jgi:type I restriction enzyme S subunit
MSNWETLPLGNVLTFQRGFDITKAEQRDGPYWVISSSGPKSTNEQFKVEGPGVIIGRKGSLGTVFYSGTNYWPHDTTLWVKDFHGNNPKFAYYFLQTMGLERLDAGSSNPSLNRNHIHTIPVLWPSPPIQRRIAGILSAYDDLIENSQRRIRILEEMARRLYRESFIDGQASTAWPAEQLGHLFELKRGYDLPARDRRPGLFPIVSSSGITGFHETFMARGPGIITGRYGTLGEVHLVWDEFWPLNTSLYVKDFKGTPFLYVFWLLRHVLPDQKGSAAAVPGLNRNDLHSLLINAPPLSGMQDFHNLCLPLANQTRFLAESIQNLRRTRDLLLPRLLSGQIDLEALPEPVLSVP